MRNSTAISSIDSLSWVQAGIEPASLPITTGALPLSYRTLLRTDAFCDARSGNGYRIPGGSPQASVVRASACSLNYESNMLRGNSPSFDGPGPFDQPFGYHFAGLFNQLFLWIRQDNVTAPMASHSNQFACQPGLSDFRTYSPPQLNGHFSAVSRTDGLVSWIRTNVLLSQNGFAVRRFRPLSHHETYQNGTPLPSAVAPASISHRVHSVIAFLMLPVNRREYMSKSLVEPAGIDPASREVHFGFDPCRNLSQPHSLLYQRSSRNSRLFTMHAPIAPMAFPTTDMLMTFA